MHTRVCTLSATIPIRGASTAQAPRPSRLCTSSDARGQGLTGLRDRIEALGGTLDVTSPAGGGTTLLIEITVKPGRASSE